MKKILIKIIISSVLLGVAIFVEHTFSLELWQLLLVYLVPYLIAGFGVIKEAVEGILNRELFDENFLMTIATVGALCIGFMPNTEPMFSEAVFVMIFFTIGELFEELAEGKSEKSIEKLMEIRPDSANLQLDNKIKKISAENVKIGDIIVVMPGEKVPVDGVVEDGKSSVNTSALTGESVPISIGVGDEIKSGMVNISGTLKVKVTRKFEESTASKIIELVKNASENKSKSESFITKFSRIYTPIVVVLAFLISIVPPVLSGDFAGNISTWLVRGLTFLVVSCPCALVISVPLSFFGGIGACAKNGILVKGSNYLEAMANLKTVVFDKTGTLTKGVFEVVAIHPEICDEEKLLHLAAHVERYSKHPIAISLKEAFKNEDDECNVGNVEEMAGEGVKATVNGDTIYVGNEKLMERLNINWKPCHHVGTTVHVCNQSDYLGHIVISDKIKEDSYEAIEIIKKSKIIPIMLTGDKEKVAEHVATELKIKEYYSELLPQDKVEKVEKIVGNKEKGGIVAFCGDGINDAPVLARADLGIAMGALGSDAAIEAADIVLMNDKASNIIKGIEIAKKTISIAYQNIIFAIAVKIIVLILAAFGYSPMWLAVFADVGVTIIAVLNAMRALKL